MPMVEPRAPWRFGTSDQVAATAAIFYERRQGTSMQLSTLIDMHGTTGHMQTHTTRAVVEGCDAQLCVHSLETTAAQSEV